MGPSELHIVLTEFVTVEAISRPVLSSKQSHSVPPSEMEAAVAVTAERDSPGAGVSGAWQTPVLHQHGGPVERYQLRERLDDTGQNGLAVDLTAPGDMKGNDLAGNPGQKRCF